MTWLLIAVAAIGVVVIALVAVGGVTQRMASLPPERVFDLDEAVDWVADRLPDSVTSQLSYDDVRMILGFHLDYLEALGVAREDTEPAVGDPGAWAAEGEARVAEDTTALAFVLGQLTGAETDIADADAAAVVAVAEDYLLAIGARGTPASEDELDGPT